jgi:predicted lactoylglutathione lyase
VILLTYNYHQFTKRPIGDARRESQAMIALTVESKDPVNATLEKTVAAGGQQRGRLLRGVALKLANGK